MRAASGLPQRISQGRDVRMSEAMFVPRRLTVLMSLQRMFQRFPGMFVSSQMLPFSLLLSRTMGMRCDVVQFRGSLVILVMGAVVITSGHSRYSRSLATDKQVHCFQWSEPPN